MRKLASIATIEKLEPIEGADKIEAAMMKGKGWRVVVGKGEFKPGDKIVYFEIDSALPADDPRYEFLKERCLKKFCTKSGAVLKEVIRIRTIKLRGVISQGLIMPLEKFEEITSRISNDGQSIGLSAVDEETGEQLPGVVIEPLIGADVTKLLKVEHYDELAEALRPQTGASISGDAISSFPSVQIPKTDEERIQNLGEYFETMRDRTFQVSVKFDGSSVTMAYSPTIDAEQPFMVCSRNLRLKPETAKGTVPLPWLMAAKYKVEEKLKKVYEETGKELAVQGELVGPGLQSNRDLLTEHEWDVFRIYNVTDQEMMDPTFTEAFCKEHGLQHVTVLAHNVPVFKKFKDIDEILKFAEGKTSRGNEREGVVFKSDDNGPYVSFKAVSNRYLLKQKD